MKIGDILYCIKNSPFEPEKLKFKKGDFVILKYIKIFNNYGYCIVLYNNENIEFPLKNKDDDFSKLYNVLEDYFITLQQYRKLKLKKINESR